MNKLLSYLIERNLVPELQKGSLGIPRSDMPQISSAHMKEFLDYARGEGVKVYHITLPASKLKPTQAEINSDKVDTFVVGNKPLMISSDNYVLDGHHQWAKIILTDENRRVDCVRVDMPIRGLLDLANNFSHTTHKSYTGEGTMKKLEKLLTEGRSPGWYRLLKMQQELTDGVDKMFSASDREAVTKALKGVDTALEPLYKKLEA